MIAQLCPATEAWSPVGNELPPKARQKGRQETTLSAYLRGQEC